MKESGLTLKYQISSLTNVPPERQKVLVRGGPLKDDADVSTLGLRAGQTVMVLGTPLENVIAKEESDVKFVEDLKKSDLVRMGDMDTPAGLTNLGNTCYLNSSLQALFTIDELKNDLKGLESREDALMWGLKETFAKLEARGGSVTPLNFLASLRREFPQFAEQDQQHGFYKQQDAEEAYSRILHKVVTKFPDMEKFFKVEFKTETKCTEVEEDPVVNFEEGEKLNCHITGATNFLQDGLKTEMKETLEKNNEQLGRNAVYSVEKKITRLPKYLNVNFVRFFWKRDTGKKAKIMRKVQFPFQLDVFELLDDSIKEEKAKFRDEVFKVEKSNGEDFSQFKKRKLDVGLTTRDQMELRAKELADLKKKWRENLDAILPGEYKTNGENPSCVYELVGVIGHKGASADSGHYQSFIRDTDDVDRWYRFDDDKVSVIDRERVMGLAGGSEGDSALLLLYRAVGL